ncbi:MAG: hypothetical protein VX642_12425 [Bdellovibrionota bacterium]|nr:hypothetical protein [Bdellovibrionota bacterium]
MKKIMGLLASTIVLGACSGGSANKPLNLKLNYLNFSDQTQSQITEDFYNQKQKTMTNSAYLSSFVSNDEGSNTSGDTELEAIDLEAYPQIGYIEFQRKYQDQIKDPSLVLGKSNIYFESSYVETSEDYVCQFSRQILSQPIYVDETYSNIFALVIEEELLEGDEDICETYSEIGQTSVELSRVKDILQSNQTTDQSLSQSLIFQITEDSFVFVGSADNNTAQVYFHIGDEGIEIKEAIITDSEGNLIERVDGSILGSLQFDASTFNGHETVFYKSTYQASDDYFSLDQFSEKLFDFNKVSSGEINYNTY